MKSLEWWIARRYSIPRRKIALINVVSWISIGGVTAGVAALIIIMSVFNGFYSLVENLLKGVDPDIRIEASDNRSMAENDSLLWSVLENHPDIKLMSPFVEGKALILHDNKNQVAYIHGVPDSLFKLMTRLEDHLVAGNLELSDKVGISGLVMGIGVADKLGIPTNVEVTVLSPVNLDRVFTQFAQPISQKMKVKGIYALQRVYDIGYAFTTIEAARYLFRMNKRISGVEIRLLDSNQAESFKNEIQAKLGEGYWVQTWYDLRKEIYSVMALEKWGAYVILALVILIASFNIVGTLMMTALEKKRDIGVLQAMGMGQEQIYRSFLNQGIIVGLFGIVIGAVIGYGIVILQITTGFYKIPNAQSFIVDAFPVAINPTDFIAIAALALVITLLSSIYPARLAARTHPLESIRYE